MNRLVESILDKNLVSANKMFSEAMEEIIERKLYEVKRSIDLCEDAGFKAASKTSSARVQRPKPEPETIKKAPSGPKEPKVLKFPQTPASQKALEYQQKRAEKQKLRSDIASKLSQSGKLAAAHKALQAIRSRQAGLDYTERTTPQSVKPQATQATQATQASEPKKGPDITGAMSAAGREADVQRAADIAKKSTLGYKAKKFASGARLIGAPIASGAAKGLEILGRSMDEETIPTRKIIVRRKR